MLIGVTGTFHNVYKDVKRGDIVEVDLDNAERHVRIGVAQWELEGPLGVAYAGTRIRYGERPR